MKTSTYKYPFIRLLGKNISFFQLLGYAFAAITGMSIIFSAFCLSRDVSPLFTSEKSLFKKQFLVVNKNVSVFSVFGKGNTSFDEDEIEELKSQEFVRSVSYFTPSRFNVRAFTDPAGQMSGLSTDLFFESVPDQLLENTGKDWEWKEESRLIPIIIPRDYLNLYNFGFAGSQDLPQISEGIMQQVVFKVSLTGNGNREVLDGRIVGLSNNGMNTILVPEAFMKWANNRFGSGMDIDKISRLIVEVGNPADPAIAEFFSAKPDYVIDNNKGEAGKLSYFLTILITAMLVAGGLIMIPSIGLMLLSINLIIYKNQKTLGNLMLLGYSRLKLSLPYWILVVLLNAVVGMLSLWISHFVRNLYIPKLKTLGIENFPDGFTSTVLFTLAFTLVISLIDVFWIHIKVHQIKAPARG